MLAVLAEDLGPAVLAWEAGPELSATPPLLELGNVVLPAPLIEVDAKVPDTVPMSLSSLYELPSLMLDSSLPPRPASVSSWICIHAQHFCDKWSDRETYEDDHITYGLVPAATLDLGELGQVLCDAAHVALQLHDLLARAAHTGDVLRDRGIETAVAEDLGLQIILLLLRVGRRALDLLTPVAFDPASVSSTSQSTLADEQARVPVWQADVAVQ